MSAFFLNTPFHLQLNGILTQNGGPQNRTHFSYAKSCIFLVKYAYSVDLRQKVYQCQEIADEYRPAIALADRKLRPPAAQQRRAPTSRTRIARTQPVRQCGAPASPAHGLFAAARGLFATHTTSARSSYYLHGSHYLRCLYGQCPVNPRHPYITRSSLYCTPAENLSRFCKIFTIVRINCFAVWNN